MDYEKKYKEALERAKQFSEKPYLEDSKGIVEYIFPELKESEDERIREWLIRLIKATCDYDSPTSRKEVDDALAWLEKQGEQKSVECCADKLWTEFQKQVAYLMASSYNREHEYTKGYVEWVAQSLLGYAKNEIEQKPAEWSEEDEKNLLDIDYLIRYRCVICNATHHRLCYRIMWFFRE